MEEAKRIRLVFKDDDILTESQKSVGLSRSWVLLKPHQHDTVSDVVHHLLRAFHLHQSCPHGLTLSISGFVLPPFESIHILKDNEIVRVQKRQDLLLIEGDVIANDVEKLKATEMQPVESGFLLLANEEFEKEKGGYESDDNEEDDQEDLLEDVENPSGAKADKENRKRKAADKLQYPKKKKQRSDASENTSNGVQTDKCQNSDQNADLTEKKSLSSKENKDDSIAGNRVQNNGEQRDTVQENVKGTEDAKTAPEVTKKRPSRSARRKSDKRRWLREMAKIRKQNATCESEGLRNWKEDQAKAYKKKVDAPVKKLNKWKYHQADAEVNAVDGQPKGLLHWTPQENWLVKGKKRHGRSQNDHFPKLPNRNDDVCEQQIQTGDVHEQATKNGDGLQQPTHKQSYLHEQTGQKSALVEECKNQSFDASEQLDQESGEENDVVPIVIRPGHIRFEPLGKEQTVQKDHAPQETFQWNGITSKKKGQQWGKESRPPTSRNGYKTSNKECSEILSNEKEKQADEEIQAHEKTDIDKLPPLLGMLKKGDVIAYRLLELSSSWTPELSAYRVGKVSWYNAGSNQTMLLPVPEYPIVYKKDDEEDEAVQPALYKEDGSLEIDFSSLIDVRIFNNGRLEPGNEDLKISASDVNAPKAVLASSSDKQIVVSSQDAIESNQGEEKQLPTAENGGATVSIWDQVTEALNTKKEQLSRQKGWGTTPKKVQTQENSWGGKPSPGTNGDKNPTQGNNWRKSPSPGSNWGKNAQKTEPTQENSWGKQNQGGKSWSYKALRGSGLGPTMAFLRSKKDVA